MAYGNDFSSTQAAADTQQAQSNAQMQAAFGHVLGTLQGLREQRNVEASRAMQQQQFAAALKQREYENQVQQQQQAVANRKLDIQNAVSQGYLKLGQDQLALQQQGGTPAQVRDKEVQRNNALQAAQRGDFYSADHAKQVYPGLSDAEAETLANTSQGVRDTMNANHQFAVEAANTVNQAADVDAEIAHLKDKKDKSNMLTNWETGNDPFTSDDAQKLKDLTAQQLKLGVATKKYMGDKRFDSLLSYDATAPASNGTTGAWKPGGAAPTFLMPPGGSPVPPAPGGADAGAGTPAAPAGPTISFMPGANTGNVGGWGVQPDTGSTGGAGGISFTGPTPFTGGSGIVVPSSQPAAPAQSTGGFPDPMRARVSQLVGSGMNIKDASRQALIESMQPASQ